MAVLTLKPGAVNKQKAPGWAGSGKKERDGKTGRDFKAVTPKPQRETTWDRELFSGWGSSFVSVSPKTPLSVLFSFLVYLETPGRRTGPSDSSEKPGIVANILASLEIIEYILRSSPGSPALFFHGVFPSWLSFFLVFLTAGLIIQVLDIMNWSFSQEKKKKARPKLKLLQVD